MVANKHFGGQGPCRFENGECVYCGDKDPTWGNAEASGFSEDQIRAVIDEIHDGMAGGDLLETMAVRILQSRQNIDMLKGELATMIQATGEHIDGPQLHRCNGCGKALDGEGPDPGDAVCGPCSVRLNQSAQT
jgi:hypothetical protein